MGCDIPDIRLTVCIGEFLANFNNISVFGQGFQRMYGSCRRCWGGVAVTATRQPLWSCCGLVKLVRSTFKQKLSNWFSSSFKKKYAWLMTRRPWCQQGFGQSTAEAECGPPDLPEGGSECYVHRQEPLQWVSFSLYASPVNYFSQSSTPRRLGWMTAPKLATSLRSVSAASASAAWAAATSATANLQMSELMLLLPGNCCPTFRQNTCKCQSFVSTNLCLAK